jgi:hypothetical protein
VEGPGMLQVFGRRSSVVGHGVISDRLSAISERSSPELMTDD